MKILRQKKYSVLLTEEEYRLFCNLEEKLFFQNATTGEYYTGEDLKRRANEIKADWSNGSVNIVDGKTGKKINGFSKKISDTRALREAYIDMNSNNIKAPGPELAKKLNRETLPKLQRMGLIKNLKVDPDGLGASYYYKKSAPKFIKKIKRFLK